MSGWDTAKVYLPYIESLVIFSLLFLYFFYRQSTPSWVFTFTGGFLVYLVLRLLFSLQRDERFLFQQALNLFAALLILYIYYVR